MKSTKIPSDYYNYDLYTNDIIFDIIQTNYNNYIEINNNNVFHGTYVKAIEK